MIIMSINKSKLTDYRSDFPVKTTKNEYSPGLDPSYEGPTRAGPEDNESFPSISELEEEHTSETIKSDDVNLIMEKSQKIASQVENRLEQFLIKTQEISKVRFSNFPSKNVSFDTKNQSKIGYVDTESIKNLKDQQDYIMKLIEQASTLQTEVDFSYTTTKKNTENSESEIKVQTNVEKCGYDGACACCLI
ncbi:hypothetical protein SteCoe_12816 [Stentor coeruleus]|uniref:Uncharacterized protein n=1 Tax=Stentor coeruleus TaxID=5963 RepID=A0A1R2C9Y3_9CILI|nr:hypothetical protein SteCoe_12816 [Stentor coeruleus]